METVAEYNAVLRKASTRLSRDLVKIERQGCLIIAAELGLSQKTIYDYRDGKGNNLKTVLTIQEAVLKYKHGKKGL